MFVKQYDSKGNLLPGVLTRHKANLVAYFRRLLHEERLYICKQIATVSTMLEKKYDNCVGEHVLTSYDLLEEIETGINSKSTKDSNTGLSLSSVQLSRLPTSEEMLSTIKEMIKQATLFRCYARNSKLFYSGKQQTGNVSSVDDMLMALILCTAWANLPKNTYVLA